MMKVPFYLYPLFLVVVTAKTFLFKLEGEVNGEEFVYYKIMHPGNLLLVLHSVEGDADIYISDKIPTPNYNPENYDLHSATCGTDPVFVSRSLKRPMAVGIYGHSGYAHSKYILEVYQLPDDDDDGHLLDDEDSSEVTMEESVVNKNKESNKKTATKSKRKLRNIPNGLWPFLELFEMLFL